jgi:NCAIR mutase (PurE)-related protein
MTIDQRQLRSLLQEVRDNNLDVDQALSLLRDLPYQDLGFAKIDHHRSIRTGSPEVVLGKGKTPGQVSALVAALTGRGHPVLVTKTDSKTYEVVVSRTPEAIFNELAGAIVVVEPDPLPKVEGVLVVTADTADLPVAEEAVLTAELMGNGVTRIHDVGVAGQRSLLEHLPSLREAGAIIVVAGMDAELAAVAAELVSAPVIAVPASGRRGAGFTGLASLLSMLNSCLPGIALVNIDNGFGAGFLASQINHLRPAKK